MYVSSSETGSFSKRESNQSLIVLANENFGLAHSFVAMVDTVLPVRVRSDGRHHAESRSAAEGGADGIWWKADQGSGVSG